MSAGNKPREKVAEILSNNAGADARDRASPHDLATEIDQVYLDHLKSIEASGGIIIRGQKVWEEMVSA